MAKAPDKSPKRRGPKPRGPYANKRRTITTRITEETRRRLEHDALAAGRSLSQEIELRLETREHERQARLEIWGNPETLSIMRAFGAVASAVSENAGRSWLQDASLYEEVEKAIGLLLTAFRPKRKGRKIVSSGLGTVEAVRVLKQYVAEIEERHGLTNDDSDEVARKHSKLFEPFAG